MSKSLPPVSPSGRAGFTAPDALPATPRRKKARPGEEADPRENLLADEGVAVAAADTAGAGAGGTTAGGEGAAAGAGTTASGGSGFLGGLFSNVWTWVGLSAAGAAVAGGGGGGDGGSGGETEVPPVAGDADLAGTEDAGTFNGTLSASDANGDALTFSAVGALPEGVVLSADGSFSVTPLAADQALDAGESRTVSFDYVVNDGTADSNTATVTITITGANDAPVAGGNATASGTEDAASITGNVPAATDVDGEALTYALTAAAPAGLTFNSDGTFSYVPQAADAALDSGETRTITFDYVASDGTAQSAPATVTLTISGANDAPVSGGNFAVSGSEEAASITGNVSATDVDGETLTYALTAAAPAGLAFNSDGSFSYAPQAADNALDSGETNTITFQYVANDGTASSAAATVTITVSGANDAPVAEDLALSASEDTPFFFTNVSGSDVDGESLTYTLVGPAPAGVSFSGSGSFSYSQDAADQALDDGETRVLSFQYFVSDGTTSSATKTVTITINGANDRPVAVTVTASGSEDDASITGAASATDVDGETLTYSTLASPPGFTLNSDGSFSYVPQAIDKALDDGETRQVILSYHANDGTDSEASIPPLISITVHGANDAPVAANATASGSEDAASITGSVSAADIDNEALTYALTAAAPAGLTFNSSGTFTYVPQAADHALAAGETRQVTFNYVANDGTTNSAPATVTITVTGSNDAPAIGLGAPVPTTPEQAGTEFRVNTTTFSTQLAPTVAELADGSFVIVWQSASQDGSGIGIYGQHYAANGSKLGGEFLVNTTTADHQSDPVVAVLSDGGFVVIWESNLQDGSAHGIYAQRFTASGAKAGTEFHVSTTTAEEQLSPAVAALSDGGFVVTWESFLQDGERMGVFGQRFAADGTAAGTEFQVNTTTTNHQMVSAVTALANGDFVVTWQSWFQGGATGWSVYGQRFAADGTPLGTEFRIDTPSVGGASEATLTALADGGFVVTWHGTDVESLKIVGQRYDADGVPVGTEFAINSTKDEAQMKPVVAALDDGGFVVTWMSYIQDGSSYGIYAQRYDANGVPAGTEFQVNTWTTDDQRNPVVTALGDGFIVAWESYFQDGSLGGIYAQRFTLASEPADTGRLIEEFGVSTISGQLVVSDADTSDTHTWTISDNSLYGNMAIAADGTWTYTLDNARAATNLLTHGQQVTETFTATVTDSAGASATRTVTIQITGTNDRPVAAVVSVTGSEDAASISGSGSATDIEGSALTYSTGTVPAGLTFNSNGTFTYVPQAADQVVDTGETRTVTFNYVAYDGLNYSRPTTVTITLTGANDAPVAANKTASGSEDAGSISSTVSATDVDVETLTYALTAAAPAGLTFNSNGSFSYVPQAADHALDSGETRQVTFQFVANDGTVNSAPATVTITINGANDAPVAGNVNFSGSATGTSLTGSLNATDVDGEALTYFTYGSRPAGLTLNSDGTFTYALPPTDAGLDDGESRQVSFQYQASDGTALSLPGTVTITVNGANDAPVAANATASGSEDALGISGSVSASDVDFETLTYALTGVVPAGLTFNSNGTFTYVPQAADQVIDTGETRQVTFQYVANDGTVNSAPATVTLTLNGANDAPVSGGNTLVSGSEDAASITGNVPAASDVDAETLTYTLTAAAPAGLTFNSDGSFSYVPQTVDNALDSGESRNVTFSYRAGDGTATSAAATVTITVTGANDAPVATNASLTSSEEAVSITGNVSATDADVETLTYALTAAAPAGLTFNSNGSFSYVPQAADQALDTGEARLVTFQYRASDGTVDSNVATVTLTITGVNDVPVSGGNATASGSEDAASITGSVPAASDVDVEALTYALTAAAPAGLAFNSDGTFSYVPQAADHALDSGESRQITFQYVANDGTSNSTPGTVTITVSGANDTPVASNVGVIGSEDDAGITGTVSASDADVEALTYSISGVTPAGLTFNSDGTFSYVPQADDDALAAGESREVTFQYVANDGTVDSAPATATITINGADESPVITAGPAQPSSPQKDGPEFRVNTTTADWQNYPAITALGDGGYVVTWHSNNQDGSGYGVYAQRFTADDTAVGSEFRVNTTTANLQYYPATVALADGGFVVAWQSLGQDPDASTGIYAQRYDADGVAVGGEFRVNTYTTGTQMGAVLGALEDGGFVVGWASQGQDGSGWGSYAQRYDAAGVAVGGEFLINAGNTTDDQTVTAIAGLPDGGFLAVWQGSEAGSAYFQDVFAQRFDADGVAVGSTFRVNTGTYDGQRAPDVAVLADGGFVIVWCSHDGYDIYGQRYDATGAAVGGEFAVSVPNDAPFQSAPEVTALADGGFVVAWTSDPQDGSSGGVYLQRYAADGTTIGLEVLGNTTRHADQSAPALATLDDGSVVLVWHSSGNPESSYGIYAQHLQPGSLAGDAGLVVEDRSATASGVLLASDDEGGTVTWSISDDSDYGSMSIDQDGHWAFTLDDSNAAVNALDEGDTLTASFTATATDTTGASSQHTVTVTVSGSNDAPQVTDITTSGSAGDTHIVIPFDVSDPEGDDVYIYQDHSTFVPLSSTPDGTVVYLPQPEDIALAEGVSRDISFDFYATDYRSFSTTATATITITGVNDAPVIGPSDLLVARSGEFQVNTFTANTQVLPSVTALADGGFVVLWTSQGQDDSGDAWGEGVYGQRYDASGVPVGSEFRVNNETASNQFLPFVAPLANGGFAVAWTSGSQVGDGQDGSGAGTYARVFDADGVALGTEFQVATVTEGDQLALDCVSLDDGGFAVLWGAPFGPDAGVYLQRYEATGSADGAPLQVLPNLIPMYFEYQPVTLLPDGNFLTLAVTPGFNGGSEINGSLLSADAQTVLSGFQVSAAGSSPVVAVLADGGFAVAFQGADDTVPGVWSDAGIRVRLYSADGTPAGDDFLVAAEVPFFTSTGNPAIVALPDGGFVVSWTSYDFTTSNDDVFAQRFDAMGTALSDVILVNATQAYGQLFSDFALLADGSLMAVWNAYVQDGDALGVFARRFSAPSPFSDTGAVNADETEAAGQLVAIDPDIGDSGSWSVVDDTPGTHYGTLTLAADGSWHYTLDATSADTLALGEDDSATETFTATFTDSHGLSDTHTITVTIGEEEAPVLADGGFVPIDREFPVNTFTAGAQHAQVVTALADGGFVVLWTSQGQDDSGDSSGNGVYGQRYDADGAPVDGEFRVNNETTADQFQPFVAPLAGGGFAVAWTSAGQDGHGFGVYARVYAADGTPLGNEFLATTVTQDSQVALDCVSLPDGGFAVLWGNENYATGGVYLQRFAADGTAEGAPVQATSGFNLANPTPVHVLADGSFLQLGTEFDALDAEYHLQGQLISADGLSTSPVFEIGITDGNPASVAVLADGSFVVAFDDGWSPSSEASARARIYNADGTPQGAEFLLAPEGDFFSSHTATVLALPDGGFVAVWGGASPLAGSGFFLRRFAADGTPDGDATLLTGATFATAPELTLLDNGTLVATWHASGADGDSLGITARAFRVAPGIDATGTVSEDATAWMMPTGFLVELDPARRDSGSWSVADDTPGTHYGTLYIAPDSSWQYVLDARSPATKALEAGESVTETLTATFTDAGGMSEQHTVTITINGTEGDYVQGSGDSDALTGSTGNDTFDGGAGALDSFDESAAASDDLYIYRYGVDGYDVITEAAAATGDDADRLEIWNAIAGTLVFDNDGGTDLLIDVDGNGSDDIRLEGFFTADHAALDADIETVVVYADAGGLMMLASYTSQNIQDMLFP